MTLFSSDVGVGILAANVAAFATFLCSEGAAGITGSAQTIDCGWTAR